MTISEITEKILAVLTDFHWTYVLEFVMFYTVIYYALKVCWRNNAKSVVWLYTFGFLALLAIALFGKSNLGVYVFLLVFIVISGFLLSMFSVEIKRSIWYAKRPSLQMAEKNAPKTKISIKEQACIDNIVHAVQNLSKNDVGALIVLSAGNLPKEVVESGVLLNSAISSQLIEGIFVPKAPLHDGAMIVYGDKIQAAGCFLPLTQKEFPKEFGTRHRAGIGVTEIADVMVIIVSEETGIISTVKEGNITRYVNTEGLKNFLKEYYTKEFGADGKKAEGKTR